MDHRELLPKIKAPTLVIAGRLDPATTVEAAEFIRGHIAGASMTIIDAAHISNVEQPDAYTEAVLDFLTQGEVKFSRGATDDELSAKLTAGEAIMTARVIDCVAVLAMRGGNMDDKKDREGHGATPQGARQCLGRRRSPTGTPSTRNSRNSSRRYAWGEIWTRPHYDERTRRVLVIGTMLALDKWAEFRMHVRAALARRDSPDDIKEIIMQQAIYCGVPAANHAFKEASALVAELGL